MWRLILQHFCFLILKILCFLCQKAIFKPSYNIDRVSQTTVLTEWQAGRHPLPSASALLWSHLLCRIAVHFTRNCYQRCAPNSDHMPRAADLRFLCLHVSQNAALYRNTETRPQQFKDWELCLPSQHKGCIKLFFKNNCIISYCFRCLK